MRVRAARLSCVAVICFAAILSVRAKNCSVGNCLSCSEDGSSCQSCIGGFVLKKNSCVPCPDGCVKCSEDRFCLACGSGLDISQSGTCCSFGCGKCAGMGRCVECRDGFRIDYSYTSCIKCDPGCKKCTRVFSLSGGFNSKCIECEEGWYYVNNICQKLRDANWNLWGGVVQTFGMFLSMGTVFYLMCCGVPECLKCKRGKAHQVQTQPAGPAPVIIQFIQPQQQAELMSMAKAPHVTVPLPHCSKPQPPVSHTQSYQPLNQIEF